MTKELILILLLFASCSISSPVDENNSHRHPYGHQFSVMHSDADGKIIVDLQKLDEALLHPEVKDRKIVVVSIIGAFRKGKSFLMDYCLRYMYGHYKSVSFMENKFDHKIDWIDAGDEPLKGFSWKSGSKRHTTGVVIWSDVFLHEQNNEKLAILLMDTQGLFDMETSPAENSRIFALGTLLSSKQIFNLNDVIQENQLEYLQLATDYAKFAAEHSDKSSRTSSKPFQQLLFLMRDWAHSDDHEYGLKGGEEYIKIILKITDKQVPELKAVREYIRKSFDKIDCFLLPHPGMKALKKGYDGRWSELELNFKEQISDFIEWFLEPKVLRPKTILGVERTSTAYRDFAHSYLKAFQSGEIPKIDSLYETTVKSQLKIYVEEAMKYFTTNMKQYDIMTSPNSIEILETGMKQLKADAILMYQSEPKLGTEEHNRFYMEKLIYDIDLFYGNYKRTALESFDRLVKAEQSKKIDKSLKHYKIAMKQFEIPNSPDALVLFERGHHEAKAAAIDLFLSKTKWGSQELEKSYIDMLTEEIEIFYAQQGEYVRKEFAELVEAKQKEKQKESLDSYKDEMKQYEIPNSPDALELFERGHHKAKVAAIDWFLSRTKWGSQELEKSYIDMLTEAIQIFYAQQFENVRVKFAELVKAKQKEKQKASLDFYKEEMEQYEIPNSAEFLVKLKSGHHKAKVAAIDWFLSKTKWGDVEKEYKDGLSHQIDAYYEQWKKHPTEKFERLAESEERKKVAESVNNFTEMMKKFEILTSPNSLEELKTGYETAKSDSIVMFKSKPLWDGQNQIETLIEKIDSYYDLWKKGPLEKFDRLIEINQNQKVSESLAHYNEYMEQFENLRTSEYLEELRNGHQQAKSSAVSLFRSKTKWGNQEKMFEDKLEADIELSYGRIEAKEIEKYDNMVKLEDEKKREELLKQLNTVKICVLKIQLGQSQEAADLVLELDLSKIDTIIEEAYGLDQILNLVQVFKKLSRLNYEYQGYKALYDQMTSHSDEISSQAYIFAFYMRNSMEITSKLTSGQTDQTLINGYNTIKNSLPLNVRAIIWNEKVHLRNSYYRGHLYPTGYDGAMNHARRSVFTKLGTELGVWQFYTNDGIEFHIRSVPYEEYLYAGTYDGAAYDDDRRKVYTWRSRAIQSDAGWNILPSKQNVIELKNTHHGEWLFTSGFMYDSYSNYAFTWRPKNREKEKGTWIVEA